MSSEFSPQVQNQIAQIQQVQQQAQTLAMQKSQIDVMIKETEMAVEELEKSADDAVVYKSVGELMIKSDKASLLTSLKERQESFSLRVQSIERQEERLNSRFKQLQEQLQSMIGTSGGGEDED
ncbi:prefoldin subunit beta [Methanimicrococcus blatticola]|uniref:Prefoldin subunit beta n=1 Tax=Methanimicrococcus blatticola TaxID=91560 RepID=A0A484F4S6_9EURY|nr:prefoldin subunit beta [Methanimicrococcus blatticola]MBZ3935425.1 prefoldin subunit beta [Methanimicrococcus blatticola]MCC2508478.1 prefoldin subunit beta [Methanimicrococcus blatticola]TDQ67787.1 prefoldin beta subunit [Methanimicrococcus blatticola]